MKKTILLVDDNEDLRKTVKEQLELIANFKVIDAANGIEALSFFKLKKIDLVISDVEMPKKSGIELMDDIHKISPTCPVILITGGGITKEFALKVGAFAFFEKPSLSQMFELLSKITFAA